MHQNLFWNGKILTKMCEWGKRASYKKHSPNKHIWLKFAFHFQMAVNCIHDSVGTHPQMNNFRTSVLFKLPMDKKTYLNIIFS